MKLWGWRKWSREVSPRMLLSAFCQNSRRKSTRLADQNLTVYELRSRPEWETLVYTTQIRLSNLCWRHRNALRSIFGHHRDEPKDVGIGCDASSRPQAIFCWTCSYSQGWGKNFGHCILSTILTILLKHFHSNNIAIILKRAPDQLLNSDLLTKVKSYFVLALVHPDTKARKIGVLFDLLGGIHLIIQKT